MKNETVDIKNKSDEVLPRTGNWSICWRATRDGWAASTIHSRCDGKSHTVTIVQVTNNNKKFVFGGYATEQWGGSGKFEMLVSRLLNNMKAEYDVTAVQVDSIKQRSHQLRSVNVS